MQPQKGKRVHVSGFTIGRYEVLLYGTVEECECSLKRCPGIHFSGRMDVFNGGHPLQTFQNVSIHDPHYLGELARREHGDEVFERYVLKALREGNSIGYGEHNETRM